MLYQTQTVASRVSVALDSELGPAFEPVVVRALLLSPPFLVKYRPLVTDDLFRDPMMAYLAGVACSFLDEHRQPPAAETIIDLIRQGDFRDRGGAIAFVESATVPDNLDYVADRVLAWARWSRIVQVIEIGERADPRDFAVQIERASRVGEQLTDEEQTLDGDDVGELTELFRPRVATPWPTINDRLNGGPELQDFAVIASFINTGKTALLINVAAAAVAQGHVVCFGTFEDGVIKSKRRFMQYVTGQTLEQIGLDPKGSKEIMREWLARTGGKMVIKRMRNRRTTVADFGSWVRSVKDRTGRPVAVAISDYMDRFAPPNLRKDPRFEYREIAEECKLLAADEDLLHWSATQANRGSKGRDVVGIEFVGESMGKVEGADLVIGAGQTEEDVVTGWMNLFMGKVRDAKKYDLIRVIADLNVQRIYEPGTMT